MLDFRANLRQQRERCNEFMAGKLDEIEYDLQQPLEDRDPQQPDEQLLAFAEKIKRMLGDSETIRADAETPKQLWDAAVARQFSDDYWEAFRSQE
jgi:hypothetical protein